MFEADEPVDIGEERHVNQFLRSVLQSVQRWSVLTTALVVVVSGVTSGSAYGQGASLPATKVGTVNIGVLFTKYRKAELFKKELETDLAPLKKEAENIKSIMKQHEDWLIGNEKKEPAQRDAAQGEKSRKAMLDGKRALEDLDMRARTLIGKKQETQLIQLYREIHAGVQSYAQQNGFHIVLAYGDPPEGDVFTFATINRKMSAMDMGAAVPFYTQTGLDISNEVLIRLNGGVQQTNFVAPPK